MREQDANTVKIYMEIGREIVVNYKELLTEVKNKSSELESKYEALRGENTRLTKKIEFNGKSLIELFDHKRKCEEELMRMQQNIEVLKQSY